VQTACKDYCGNQAGCLATSGCKYNTTTQTCSRKVCEYAAKSDCQNDPSCVWDKFAPTPCRANYCLVGARKKRKIQIGDKLQVKVIRADWEALQVDFEAIFPEGSSTIPA
jgi:hypothetical protein